MPVFRSSVEITIFVILIIHSFWSYPALLERNTSPYPAPIEPLDKGKVRLLFFQFRYAISDLGVTCPYRALIQPLSNPLSSRIFNSWTTTDAGTSGSPGSTYGVETISQFNNSRGVAISADGTYDLEVADWGNHLIRRSGNIPLVRLQFGK
jgi:hypothetical protein